MRCTSCFGTGRITFLNMNFEEQCISCSVCGGRGQIEDAYRERLNDQMGGDRQ